MHENREPSEVSRSDRDRSEKALSRTAHMYASEESDHAVVPVSRPNNEGKPSAEVVEERAWRKENVVWSSTSPTLSGNTRVPWARRRAKGRGLFVSSERGAQCISSARWDLCGGCRVTGIPTAIASINPGPEALGLFCPRIDAHPDAIQD